MAAVLAVSLLVLHVAFRERPRSFGDAGEYFLLAESLFNHGTPDLHGADLLSLGQAARNNRLVGSYGPLLRHYRPGRDGRPYGLHFWAYSLACLPAKAVLHALGENELKALPITNALLLVGVLVRIVLLSPLPVPERWTMGALLASCPVLAFVRWPHPEVFSCAFVALALWLDREGKATGAILCAALASLQNPPLLLLALALWARHVHRPFATLALLPAALPATFSLRTLGVLNPLTHASCAAAFVSLKKAAELFFDLNLGLVPHVPLALLAALAGPLVLWRAGRPVRGLLGWMALAAAMALTCTLTTNWNHGTTGPSRYAVWLLPFVFLVVARLAGEAKGRASAVFVVAAVISQAAILAARGHVRAPMDYTSHSAAARFVLARWPALYTPSPEIFVERTEGNEEVPRRAVVYRADGRCRKALVQKRHLGVLVKECGRPPALPDVRGLVARRGRNAWFYVDY